VSVICFEMKGARGPNITQVVKPVSKYKKQASSAFQLPLRSETIKRLIELLPLCRHCLLIPKKKTPPPGSKALMCVPSESAALPC
jgi:hypothetical protein